MVSFLTIFFAYDEKIPPPDIDPFAVPKSLRETEEILKFPLKYSSTSFKNLYEKLDPLSLDYINEKK